MSSSKRRLIAEARGDVYISARRWRMLPRGLREQLSETLGGHRIRKHHVSSTAAKLRAMGKNALADRLLREAGQVMAQDRQQDEAAPK